MAVARNLIYTFLLRPAVIFSRYLCREKSPCGMPLFCRILWQDSGTPRGDFHAEIEKRNRLSVCLYFAAKCDKVEAYLEVIFLLDKYKNPFLVRVFLSVLMRKKNTPQGDFCLQKSSKNRKVFGSTVYTGHL